MKCQPIVFAAFALFPAIPGCGRTPIVPQLPPTIVSVSNPLEKEVTYHTDFTGRTVAVDSVEVRAHVWGYLDKINFKEGDLVKEDDILFEIDPRTYQAQLDNAMANLKSEEATVIKTKAIFERSDRLLKTNAVSNEDWDIARGNYMVAEAGVLLAKANLRTAELNLGFTKVKAQISGRISKYYVTRGNIIQSGDQNGGTLLTTIVSVDPMYANFDVDEHTVLHVRKLINEGKAKSVRDGQVPVYLGLANETGFPQKGLINFVDNQINPGTGTLRLRGVFPNKKGVLSPGLFVRVRVLVGEPYKAILVTDRAIDSDQGQKIVYTVNDNNEVVARPVELGSLEDGLRVIDGDVTTKDRVIVTGLQQVRPGVVVDPKVVPMPLSPAAMKRVAEKKQ